MTYEAYIQEAIAIVLAWDTPIEDFATVVLDHAKVLAGTELVPLEDASYFAEAYLLPA